MNISKIYIIISTRETGSTGMNTFCQCIGKRSVEAASTHEDNWLNFLPVKSMRLSFNILKDNKKINQKIKIKT